MINYILKKILFYFQISKIFLALFYITFELFINY